MLVLALVHVVGGGGEGQNGSSSGTISRPGGGRGRTDHCDLEVGKQFGVEVKVSGVCEDVEIILLVLSEDNTLATQVNNSVW